jgi:hypothetical protein
MTEQPICGVYDSKANNINMKKVETIINAWTHDVVYERRQARKLILAII